MGRIRLGKETLATISGYWDGLILITDKRTGVRLKFCVCACARAHMCKYKIDNFR